MLVTVEPEVSEYPQYFKGMVPICLTWTMKMTFVLTFNGVLKLCAGSSQSIQIGVCCRIKRL